MSRSRYLFAACLPLLGACSSSSNPAAAKKPPPPPPPTVPSIADFMESLKEDTSCVLSCNPSCKEADSPWVCPALARWDTIPHDPSCGSFDGATMPIPVQGKCTTTLPSGQAAMPASKTATPVVLPDGRRVAPSGTEWVFDASALPGGFPAHALLVPGGRWLVVSDDGYDTNALRVIDTTILGAGGTTSPVTTIVRYESPSGLNYGLAYASASNILYASGNLASSKILAFDLDTATGRLAEDTAHEIALPSGTLPQAIDLSPDGQTLIVSQALDYHTLVYSLAGGSYGKQTGSIDLGPANDDAFALHFDPNDPTGQTAYTTLWTSGITPSNDGQMALVQVNLGKSTATSIAVGKAPEELAFLNARYAVVANALSDSLSVVDRTAGKVVNEVGIPVQGQAHGAGPSALAFDAAKNRLYVTLSSVNGVAAFDCNLSGVPVLTLAGVIPTSWWPTSVVVDPSNGTIYVTTGKGHGSGTDDVWRDFDTGEVSELIRGSVQAVPYMTDAALAKAEATFDAQNQVASLPGQPTVDCKGAPYDFPVPEKVSDGPSAALKYIYFIVRENKTFDDLFGDLPNVDGDAKLVMAPGNMEAIWGNARKLATTFAHMDNYYSDAEQSIQGHAWTVFGRTTDYTERRWLDIWGRAEFSILDQPGVSDDTTPVEGTVFSWLANAGVAFNDMGELVGGLQYRNLSWPGGSSSSTIPDTLGACYMSALARVYCTNHEYAKPFTYAWLPNDHGFGYAAGYPNPAIMIATNDEATGMLVDGISHSPLWENALIIVIEDDPNTGSDHVDLHRSISLFASPWVKRGYLSHGHYDVASLHKLFANVLGKPYRNATIANAALPLDMFTSTPDYTPYTYRPRGYPVIACNKAESIRAMAASRWDFREPDNQPGLGGQMWEALRSLPPHDQAGR
jgi:DNA-binding beta-propeller fold protein YncE